MTTRHHLSFLVESHEDALLLVNRAAGVLDRAATRSVWADAPHTQAIKRLTEDAYALQTAISRVISELEEVRADD